MVWRFLPLKLGAQGSCPMLPEHVQMKYGDVASASKLHCLHLPVSVCQLDLAGKCSAPLDLFQSQREDSGRIFKMLSSLSSESSQ